MLFRCKRDKMTAPLRNQDLPSAPDRADPATGFVPPFTEMPVELTGPAEEKSPALEEGREAFTPGRTVVLILLALVLLVLVVTFGYLSIFDPLRLQQIGLELRALLGR